MASLLDTAILLGAESTYGTPATLSRAYEGQIDAAKRVQEVLESVGFRGGMDTARSDRRIQINMGGEGSLEFDLQNKGFGLLLQAMLGTSSGPTQVAATTAYETTVATSSAAPTTSYTVQMQRVAVDGTTIQHTYHGGVITGWTLAQTVGDLLKVTLPFDYEDSDTTTGAGTVTYPAATTPFHWGQMVCTVNSVATDVTDFSVTETLGFKTDRRFLRGSVLKKQPIRNAVPAITGSISLEYNDDTEYDLWAAGTIFPITAVWTGAEIEAGHNFSLTMTLPACQFDGDSPVANLADVPTLTMPFKALDDGTDPAVSIVYKSTDTAL